MEFVGWVDRARLRDLYDETDLFVLSSLAEGIPIVLMEAMAMQIPCVAPRIAGIPELIDDGVSGMLYTVADVQELTQKICALIRSPETSAQMGIRGRARVLQEYDMAANTERFAAAVVERLDGSNVPT